MFSENNPLVINENNMTITYDIRIEAVYCLLLLSGYDIISPYSKKYQIKIIRAFKDILKSDYVEYFSSICFDKFRYVIPCSFALSIEYDNGKIFKKGTMKEEYIKRLGGSEEVARCIESLKDFINESNFLDFFHENQYEYLKYLQKYRSLLFAVMDDVQKWYGKDALSYTAYLSQLVHPGGYSVGIDTAACVLGSILNPDYTINESMSINVCFHEFSHYFIDKFIFDNWQDICLKVNYLSSNIYSDDYIDLLCQQELFSESIIRAIANYYCYKKSKSINRQDFIKYPYSQILYETLKKKNIAYISNEVLDMVLTKIIDLMNKEKN